MQNTLEGSKEVESTRPTVRIERTRTLSGPNIYHHEPVVVAVVESNGGHDGAQGEPTRDLVQRVVELLPGIAEHGCSEGHQGGFLREMTADTSLAHVVEHVTLELAHRAGIGTGFGRTLAGDRPGLCTVVLRARAPEAMIHLVEQSAAIVNALVSGETVNVSAIIDEGARIAADTELGPSTGAIVDAARRRGIPVMRIGEQSLVQLGYGRRRRFVQAAVTDGTSGVGIEVVGDKVRFAFYQAVE